MLIPRNATNQYDTVKLLHSLAYYAIVRFCEANKKIEASHPGEHEVVSLYFFEQISHNELCCEKHSRSRPSL